MKPYSLTLRLLSAALLSVWPAVAGPLRIALLSDTTIQGDAIFLSHLLPSNVPLEVLARAASLSLGAAPALGSTRRISRDTLNSYLTVANFSTDAFTVPESVTVRRAGSAISREDVSRAINVFLLARGDASARPVRAIDVQMDTPTLSLGTYPGLQVTEVVYDPLLRRARYRLRSRTNPRILPFYAWICSSGREPAELEDVSTTAFSLRDTFTGDATAAAATRVVLVEPSRMASLYLHSSNLSTLIRVRPLQTGQKGEVIRVRVPKNGTTLMAKVVGTDFVEAVF